MKFKIYTLNVQDALTLSIKHNLNYDTIVHHAINSIDCTNWILAFHRFYLLKKENKFKYYLSEEKNKTIF